MEEVVVVVLEKKPKAQAPQAFFFAANLTFDNIPPLSLPHSTNTMVFLAEPLPINAAQ